MMWVDSGWFRFYESSDSLPVAWLSVRGEPSSVQLETVCQQSANHNEQASRSLYKQITFLLKHSNDLIGNNPYGRVPAVTAAR